MAKLILKGTTTSRELAEKLGVSIATIERDRRRLEQHWLNEQTRAMNKIKAKALAELDLLKQNAWNEFEDSKGERTKETVRETDKGSETTTTTEKLTGDARYLAAVQKAIDKQVDIHGLTAKNNQPSDDSNVQVFVYIPDNGRDPDIINGVVLDERLEG